MIREKLIERCRDEQATFAVETLANPGEMSAQAYAYRAGFFAGLRHAEAIIRDVIDEDDDERNTDREPSFA
jgi:hypothetical protein